MVFLFCQCRIYPTLKKIQIVIVTVYITLRHKRVNKNFVPNEFYLKWQISCDYVGYIRHWQIGMKNACRMYTTLANRKEICLSYVYDNGK